GTNQSLETFAVGKENVVVCKSMSKVYALSGARVAYLCAGHRLIKELRALTPPWAVSLLGQVAAVAALQDQEYYVQRYEETHVLRTQLADGLKALSNLEIVPSVANFLLCHLPENGVDAATVVDRCRPHRLFLRDAKVMGTQLGNHALRIAVKDEATNNRMLKILAHVLDARAH
ncbi:MAG TPA: aminotransferase class I/II-fold pyridoxal phosphate-dependent enzyme, partial [Pyrinomonadaceae bacterium]|nr:aminotransferase class I/II-fold pyridoxal phosphate-dependent enzyme [Pyrinomonadaceae bacterium]